MIQMGKLIRQLRKQQNLTQEELGGELVSKAELSRIENGLKTPDIFLLNTLVHRLGESLDHFEIIVTGTEYDLARLRSVIQKSLQSEAFTEAGEYLKQYEDIRESKKPLHLEYMKAVKGAIKAKRPKADLAVPELPKTLISECDLLKDIRKAKGWSQEQFSGDICARETISFIENGRTPNQKILEMLLEKWDIAWENYHGFVEAEEFGTYRMVREYRSMAEENKEEAGALLSEIKQKIDVSRPVNRQFLEGSELLQKLREGRANQELLKKLEQCLRYTMPEYDGRLHRIPYCEEVVLLQGMVDCMKRLKRWEAAMPLQQSLTNKLGKKLKVS